MKCLKKLGHLFQIQVEVYFDINKTYIESIRRGESSKVVLKDQLSNMQKFVSKIAKIFLML